MAAALNSPLGGASTSLAQGARLHLQNIRASCDTPKPPSSSAAATV
jgi:hypothetical protein